MHTPSLEDEAIDRVDRWLRAAIDSTTGREQRAFAPLRRLIEDPQGVPFAMRFIDRVVRPDEPEIAAQQLRALVADAPLPRFLPATDRALLRLGAWLSGAKEYRYLERSIAAFPPAEEFAELMRASDLEVLDVVPLTFGVCHLYVATPKAKGAD